ncbi:MAG: N-acetylmuramidase domain-containing protein [Hyphomonadaceae bacterium]
MKLLSAPAWRELSRGLLPRAQPAAATVAAPLAATPPPPAAPQNRFALEKLVASDRAPVTAAMLDASARRLKIEPEHIRAIVMVESGGQAFAGDARPIVLFDPTAFSRLTGGAHDAAHPDLSHALPKAGALGGTQAERWAKLRRAAALDEEAALKAASWGMFQLAGEHHAAAGYRDVYAMVQDLSDSAVRQLAAFERFVRARSLGGALRRKDWAAFARDYNGEAGAARYADMLRQTYVAAKRTFIDALAAKSPDPLTPADIANSAARLGVDEACLRAVLKVESRGRGFAPDGKPFILFEPYVFSRLTRGRHGAAHPTLSHRTWRERPYPATQAERYAQLAEAYALDSEAALSAASWGMFQMLGRNFTACGFKTAAAFVADMAQSEARQLAAFEAFVRANNILDDLQRRDWAGFARIYNGPGQAELYARLLAEAHAAGV